MWEEFGYRDTPVYENDDLKNFEKKIKIKMVIANQYNTKKKQFYEAILVRNTFLFLENLY